MTRSLVCWRCLRFNKLDVVLLRPRCDGGFKGSTIDVYFGTAGKAEEMAFVGSVVESVARVAFIFH